MAVVAVAMAAVAGGCGADDDTTEGTRSECAQGGVLTDCPDAERTPEAACWRMVDCGAISVVSDNDGRFTWARCANALEALTGDRQRLVINCIAASSCDELRVDGSPTQPNPNDMRCLRFGGIGAR